MRVFYDEILENFFTTNKFDEHNDNRDHEKNMNKTTKRVGRD